MTHGMKTALIAGVALAGLGLAGSASAMPAQGLQPAIATSADVAAQVENVRLICPPYRPCFYVPGGYYRPYGYGYGYARPYGFYRPFGYGPRRFY